MRRRVSRARERPPAAAERRLVTVLAATPPVDDDPETLRRRLDEVLATARDVLARYDGELERFGPEGLVAVFGADTPRDDDALRAVRAAAELGLPAGIATGESVDRRRLACSHAGPPSSRAAAACRRTSARAQLVRARSERRLDAPLVGRTEELRRLRVAFDAAAGERRCRVVTVLGEPGIGKTRLGRELVESVAGEAETLVGRCVSYGKGLTFMPLVDALRGLAAVPSAALPTPDGELGLGAPCRPRRCAGRGHPRRVVLGRATPARGPRPHAARPAAARRRPLGRARIARSRRLPRRAGHGRPTPDRQPGTPGARTTRRRADRSRPTLRRRGARARGGGRGPRRGDAGACRRARRGKRPVRRAARRRSRPRAATVYRRRSRRCWRDGSAGSPTRSEQCCSERRSPDVSSRGASSPRSPAEPIDAALSSLSRRSFVHPADGAGPGDDGYRFHHVLLRDAAYATSDQGGPRDLHERTAAWLDRNGSGDDALVGYHLEQAVLYRRELGEDADELATAAGERLGEAGMRDLADERPRHRRRPARPNRRTPSRWHAPGGAPVGASDRTPALRSTRRGGRCPRERSARRGQFEADSGQSGVRASAHPPLRGRSATRRSRWDAGPGNGPPASGRRHPRARQGRDLARIRPLARVPLRGVRSRCRARGAALCRFRILAEQMHRDPGGGLVLRRRSGS